MHLGSLRLDQIKLGFTLSKDTGLPEGFHPDVREESNYLIEELMLLANMSVAKFLCRNVPDLALLRRHPSPSEKVLDDLVTLTNALGIPIDVGSSKAIHVG